MTSLDMETIPGFVTILGRIGGILIFAGIGVFLSFIWDKKERDLRRLFFVGMAAFSIGLSVYNSIQSHLGTHQVVPRVESVIHAGSSKSPKVFETSRRLSIVIAEYELVHADCQQFKHSDLNVVAVNTAPLIHVLTTASQKREKITHFLSGIFRAIGFARFVPRLTVVFSLMVIVILILILAFLMYRAWVLRNTTKTREIYREHLHRPDPDLQTLQKKMKDAGITFEKATELLARGDPIEKGLSALGDQKFEEAINRFSEVIKQVSNAFYYRSTAYFDIGQYDQSINDLDRFLQINPSYALAWVNRGAALGKLGRNEEALESYDKALELNPDSDSVLNGKAWLLIDREIDLEKGIESVKKALELSPSNGRYEDTLGWGLYKKGRYRDAIEYIENAARKLPDDREIQKHLTELKSKVTESISGDSP